MIDTIYNVGDDALINEWEISFLSFPGVVDLDNTIIRTTDVKIPATTIDTYTIEYGTQTMTKPKGIIKTENNFDFTFRIDKYWKVYEGIENWLKAIIDPDTGAMGLDGLPGTPSTIRIPIDVVPIDANGTVTKKGWQFVGCYPSSLTGIDFKQGDGSPLTATVTMQFIKKIQRV